MPVLFPIGKVVGRTAVESRVWQVLLVIVAWSYLWALHSGNDGLWFQGDSPIHAANGLFWKDYLKSLSGDPQGFALDYYARYPVINPTSYPPVFYLIEAAAYSLCGPSPYVAKHLVLGFTLVASLYTTAWLRRWISPEAGYLGAAMPLVPAVAQLSHVIMLNVPAMAITAGALYHALRWLDEPESPQIYAAAVLSVLAILCYIPSAPLVFVLFAWVLATKHWRLLRSPRTLAVATASGLVLFPWVLVVLRWSPAHVEMTTPAARTLAQWSSWMFYPRALTEVCGPILVGLAGVGIGTGVLIHRWRREVVLLIIWVVITIALLTYLKAKDERYVLPLTVPLICLGAIPFVLAARFARTLIPKLPVSFAMVALAMPLLGTMAWQTWHKPLPEVRGYQELADFLATVQPDGPVFYDGHYTGVFSYFVRAGDVQRRRQVVRGDKLLYIVPLNGSMRPRDFVSSRAEVIAALQERSGCAWLAIEQGSLAERPRVARLLREAVRGPEFEPIRSFAVSGNGLDRVDVYRQRGRIATPTSMDIPIPMAGEDAYIRWKPPAGRLGR